MNATQISLVRKVCRPTPKRPLAAGLIAGLLAVLSGIPAVAGTSADPDITDPSGDANFVSALTADQRDTRPASTDNADLRAVWFETAYSTSKVVDPNGAIRRVDHRATGLVVRINTQAPVRPLAPWSSLRFKVLTTVPACRASIELLVAASPSADVAEIAPASLGTRCNEQGSIVRSSIKPSYEGAISTLTFPFTDATFAQLMPEGTVLSQTSALVIPQVGAGSNPQPLDQTSAGRTFTVGQDVPADIDCTANTGHPECQP